MGLSRAAIRSQLRGSLRRLRTDHLDVVYTHIDDRNVPFEETLGALSEAVDEGLVREFAASNLTVDRLREAMSVGAPRHYAALQQRFTAAVPSSDADLRPHVLLDGPTAEACTAGGLTMLGYSPLLSGAYTRSHRSMPDGYEKSGARMREVLAEIAQPHGMDAGQAVIAWMSQRDTPVIPVVGVSSPEQVRSAHQAAGTLLPAEDLRRIEEARDG